MLGLAELGLRVPGLARRADGADGGRGLDGDPRGGEDIIVEHVGLDDFVAVLVGEEPHRIGPTPVGRRGGARRVVEVGDGCRLARLDHVVVGGVGVEQRAVLIGVVRPDHAHIVALGVGGVRWDERADVRITGRHVVGQLDGDLVAGLRVVGVGGVDYAVVTGLDAERGLLTGGVRELARGEGEDEHGDGHESQDLSLHAWSFRSGCGAGIILVPCVLCPYDV